MADVNDFLEHYGVKGMKWGVRRKRGSDGRVSTEAKRADEILTKAKTQGGVKALTNKELGDLNKRLQLEKTYAQLNPPKPSPSKRVASFLAEQGMKSVQEVAKNEMNKQVKGALEKKIESSKTAKKDKRKGKRTENWLNEKDFVPKK